jgi:hypothetical protein
MYWNPANSHVGYLQPIIYLYPLSNIFRLIISYLHGDKHKKNIRARARARVCVCVCVCVCD